MKIYAENEGILIDGDLAKNIIKQINIANNLKEKGNQELLKKSIADVVRTILGTEDFLAISIKEDLNPKLVIRKFPIKAKDLKSKPEVKMDNQGLYLEVKEDLVEISNYVHLMLEDIFGHKVSIKNTNMDNREKFS